MENPYAVTTQLVPERGVFSDHAKLIRGTFLFRKIDFSTPVEGRLVYSGWWWMQRVHLDGKLLWRRISWKTIHSKASFEIPLEMFVGANAGADLSDPLLRNSEAGTSTEASTSLGSASKETKQARIEIEFSRTLFIRRFRIWIEEELVYDEIN